MLRRKAKVKTCKRSGKLPNLYGTSVEALLLLCRNIRFWVRYYYRRVPQVFGRYCNTFLVCLVVRPKRAHSPLSLRFMIPSKCVLRMDVAKTCGAHSTHEAVKRGCRSVCGDL